MTLTSKQENMLIEEVKQTATAIQAKNTSFGQFGLLGVLILAAVAGISKDGDGKVILLAAPPALCIILAFMMQLFGDALALGVYIETLQNKLNETLQGEGVKLAYNDIMHKRRYLSILGIQVVFLMLICSAYVASGMIAFNLESYRSWGIVFFYASTFVGFGTLILAVIDGMSSESAAQRILGGGPADAKGAFGLRRVSK
ncbi:hypothetical protein NMG29_39290 [Streptomyces cocklensis]|uniref:Uncharacterized protein n=1 Tax=Actinacidiphila cocklensis TaxID=887465 RepID=A0A9W4EAN8_9ACTN|nr:hypothetical protein [Actinacidiphila cocklensis]MDD1064127.1 hypothetical protein [Actinacidiphila cocklensis]CAG6397590.1 membrane hypothetical protein [Actinacidiphila cocklensis]